jgi:hypothetical protein
MLGQKLRGAIWAHARLAVPSQPLANTWSAPSALAVFKDALSCQQDSTTRMLSQQSSIAPSHMICSWPEGFTIEVYAPCMQVAPFACASESPSILLHRRYQHPAFDAIAVLR